MPISRYGVLKGRVVDCVAERGTRSPHYNIRVHTPGGDWRVSVNVRSHDHGRPELLFHLEEDFNHPVTEGLVGLPEGFRALASRPGGLALDYVRMSLVDRRGMHLLPAHLPGPDNDLNEKLEFWLRRAEGRHDVFLYAFGGPWGPEEKRDAVFRFRPGRGMHEVHMNQGNPRRRGRGRDHSGDNGIYQDGALLLHFASRDLWIAIFLAFQGQAWITDERGHPATAASVAPGPKQRPAPEPAAEEPPARIRIMAAKVNPRGDDFGRETVTLLNTSRDVVDLSGWTIANRDRQSHALSGTLPPHSPLVVPLPAEVPLSNQGGIINLFDEHGFKVHGVAYTKRDAAREGELVVFRG